MAALLSAVFLSWVVLGLVRGAGTIALNHDLQHGLYHLAALNTWKGFFDPSYLGWSAVLLVSSAAAAVLSSVLTRGSRADTRSERLRPMHLRGEGARDAVVAALTLAVFWAVAAVGEMLSRTPVRDVMTQRLVISGAQAGVAVIAACAFVATFACWRLLREARSGTTTAVAMTALGIVAIVLASSRLGAVDAAANPSRPNVLLITIDALRADHLSAYGYPRATTPRIDELAKNAVLYESSISQASSTRPSMAAMLTSEYPTAFTGRPFKYVPYSLPTLAEVLLDAGYETGAVVSNVWLKSSLGFDQGFEGYDQRSAMSEFYADSGRVHWKNSKQVTDAALAFLAHCQQRRFFLWLHYLDPHHPYEPQPPFDRKFAQPRADHAELIQRLRSMPTNEQTKFLGKLGTREIPVPDDTFQAVVDQYDGEIAYTDEQIGRVLDELDTLGVSADTMVVITADHGEEFRDHDGWGHGHSLYQEVIHVPLIVRYPGDPGGRRVVAPVRTIDVAPTILAVAGLAVPTTMRGSDLRRAGERSADEPVSVCPQCDQLSIEAGHWKLITPRGGHGAASLYDVAADPREHTDLAAREQGRVSEMLALLVERVGPEARGRLREQITGIDASSRKQLEALGYVD